MIHKFRGDYKIFSNFYPCNINFNGIIFPSVEHAYQSEKSIDPNWKLRCSDPNISPSIIKKESYNVNLVPNWGKYKLYVMEYCLKQKFSNEPFRSKLILTGDENIQEGNFHEDRFWGIDLNVTPNIGENHLGRMLMKIRDNLKEIR